MVDDPKTKLVTALKALRIDLREVTEGFLLRTESEIEGICEHIRRMPAASVKELARLTRGETRDLKLKPAKGRVKDLKRIDGLVDRLRESISVMDDTAGPSKSKKKNRKEQQAARLENSEGK